jgi:uncharacterized protein YndB with AHSA1/START domain
MAAKDLLERLLSPVEVRATVPAAPNAVFAVLSDPETYPDWLAGAQRIRKVDGDFPAPGSHFDHEVGPSDHLTVADRTKALTADAPNQLALEVHAGPLRGIVEFELERTGEGTLVTFRERITGALGPTMVALRGPIFLRNKGSLGKLRQRFEPLVVRL